VYPRLPYRARQRLKAQLAGYPTREASSLEERALDEALYYAMFATAYGWTPHQVDEQPAVVVERLLVVAQIRAELAAETRRT
jgi:hypothetical protein